MPKEKHFEGFYTASEAMSILGLSRVLFYRQVNNGNIPSRTIPNYTHKIYPKRDIDALALAMSLVFSGYHHIFFSRSTPADQLEEMDLGIRAFGSEFITPLEARIDFQRKSEFTFWSLKVNGKVTGYISMFRFKPSFLDSLLTGNRIEHNITVKDVQPFIRKKPFDIYIDVMAVDPDIELHRQRLYAGLMIGYTADALLNLLANGYDIKTLYTVTATKEGDALVRNLGFTLMQDKSQVPGRIAYRFDLNEQGIAMLKALSRRDVYKHERDSTNS